MEDKVMKEIVEYVIKQLNNAYGFCGVAQNEKTAIINSADRAGNDIKISIVVRSD